MHLLLAAALLATHGPDDTFKLKLMYDGAMAKIGYYAPQRVTLSEKKPEGIKKFSEGLASPQIGVVKIASACGRTYFVVIDGPEGKPASLFIDALASSSAWCGHSLCPTVFHFTGRARSSRYAISRLDSRGSLSRSGSVRACGGLRPHDPSGGRGSRRKLRRSFHPGGG
jgi:hypothetical protein